MVNVLSIICVTSVLLSNFASATLDLHGRRSRHHNAVRIGEVQRRAAEEHHAAVLVDRSTSPTPPRRMRKRSGRCPAKSTTASASTLSPTSTAKTTTALIVNPGGDPTTASSDKPKTTSHAQTTTTKKAVVKPTTTTHTSKAVTTTKAATSGGSGTTFSGDGTYYGVGLGACGWTNTDEDLIVAVSHLLYDNYPGATANPNDNPVCGKYITASYGGNDVTVKVVDRCVGCAEHDLDFSPTAFSQLADQSLGRIKITWQWSS